MDKINKYWTEDEDTYIRNNIGLTYKELALKLNRTVSSITHRVKYLSLNSINKLWNESQEIKLKELYLSGESISNICKILDMNSNKIYLKLKKLNILKHKMEKHNMSGSKLYQVWRAMKSRCYTKKNEYYHRYGERGIVVCEEWKNSFITFYSWASKNGYEEGLSIERINNDGNYCPENCRWATILEQSNNTCKNVLITAFGETKTLRGWSNDKRCKTSKKNLASRIQEKGWNPEKAIITPVRGTIRYD